MSIISIVVVFILTWWFAFFLALPIGVRRTEDPALGHEVGAPAKPRLKLKMLMATVGGALMTLAIYYIAESDLITFRVD